MKWRSVQITPSWRWQKHDLCLKPQKIILKGSVGQYNLHMKPMFNEGILLHYAQGNIEQEKPCIVHIFVFRCIQ